MKDFFDFYFQKGHQSLADWIGVEIILQRWSRSRDNREYIRILYKKPLA